MTDMPDTPDTIRPQTYRERAIYAAGVAAERQRITDRIDDRIGKLTAAKMSGYVDGRTELARLRADLLDVGGQDTP